VTILSRLRWKKRRRYPIKRDELGRSTRQRCFEQFEDHVPLEDIARTTGAKISTVHRYHQQWQKNPKLENEIAYFKWVLGKHAPNRDRSIELLAKMIRIEKQEVEAILVRPHGIRRLLTQKFYFPGNADQDHKRYVALELACFIADYLMKHGGSLEDVRYAFERWMKTHQARREEEDEDTKEENRTVAFLRAILDGEAERERRGRVQPDELSPEERRKLIEAGERSARRSMVRTVQKAYWFTIGELTALGLTEEQARDKLYQELIAQGETKAAEALRAFQDVIHPLKPPGSPPPESPQPPQDATT